MEFRGLTRFTIAIVILLYFQTCCFKSVKSCTLGECTAAVECPILVTLRRSQENINIIRRHRCGSTQSRSICCSDLWVDLVENSNALNDTDRHNTVAVVGQFMTPCGNRTKGGRRRVNGENALLHEFPWMALLEFEHKITKERKFLCGGSLISDRYVLTAAHCFMGPDTRLVNVRLGEYDTSNDRDCSYIGGKLMECAPPVQIHEFEEVILHKEFRIWSVFNDIALIRLKEKAVYGRRTLPICLPILNDYRTNLDVAIVAGWGFTAAGNASNILQKTDVPVLSDESCVGKFALGYSSAQICAGGIRGKDTCKGDSGGPLFQRGGYDTGRFVQYGILSAGGIECGGNNTTPSIYTKVSHYMPWIIKNMKP